MDGKKSSIDLLAVIASTALQIKNDPRLLKLRSKSSSSRDTGKLIGKAIFQWRQSVNKNKIT